MWCFWTAVLEKNLESPLDCKKIQAVNPKGYQSWIFIGRTDAEAETPILWSPYMKNWLLGKDPDTGKDWRREEKGTTEDEMVGWHHWFGGHEFDEAPGAGDGQGSLACCSPCSLTHQESDTTEHWTEIAPLPPCVLSCVWLFATPWTIPREAPLSMEFSRQEYWSGLPFPTSGDLLDPGIEPACLAYLALEGELSTTSAIRIVHFHLLDKSPIWY